jgi:RNA polymerase sigma factor (TIGR02999 family)
MADSSTVAQATVSVASWTPEIENLVRRLASRELARRRRQLSLQVTELVHEVYLRLPDLAAASERNAMLALVGTVVRGAAVDLVRRRMAAKRGGGWCRLELDPELAASLQAPSSPHPDILWLDQALERLAAIDPLAMRTVEARYFAGLSIEETAEALGVGRTTVTRRWRWARAWLLAELGDDR